MAVPQRNQKRLNTYKAGVADLDVKYLCNFGPQTDFNIYKLQEGEQLWQINNTFQKRKNLSTHQRKTKTY
jgi:hypothetical protein